MFHVEKKNTIVFFLPLFQENILVFVIFWQQKNFLMLPVDEKIYYCMLPVDKGDKEEKKKPLAKAHPLPHNLQNWWLKTS